MKPYIICHMITSLDGGLHPSKWTTSPDGARDEWSDTYESIHKQLNGQAWIVGRVTMAEISKAKAHPVSSTAEVKRPVHVASVDTKSFAIGLDQHGKLHFDKGFIEDDHVIVLLGNQVSDEHLAELAADGVSYIVSESAEMDLAAMMETLGTRFPVKRLLLEGGGGINGSFFASGLVDELSIVLTPSLDGRKGGDRIVEYSDVGLAGKCQLSLVRVDKLDGGILHLRYDVSR